MFSPFSLHAVHSESANQRRHFSRSSVGNLQKFPSRHARGTRYPNQMKMKRDQRQLLALCSINRTYRQTTRRDHQSYHTTNLRCHAHTRRTGTRMSLPVRLRSLPPYHPNPILRQRTTSLKQARHVYAARMPWARRRRPTRRLLAPPCAAHAKGLPRSPPDHRLPFLPPEATLSVPVLLRLPLPPARP